jgi:osmotically inducible lipoprotein OsmB
MRTMIIAPVLVAAAFAVSACGYTTEQRAASGAIIGAAAGQAIGGNTESTIGGAVVGGVAGAATAN